MISQIYPKTYETGYDMYKQMYYYAGVWRPGSWETREEFSIQVRAAMTQHIHAKLMVWVNTKSMDTENIGTYERYSACSYHSVSSPVKVLMDRLLR